MLDTQCSELVRRVRATHSIRQFLLHFPSHASPCAITFQLDCTADTDCGVWYWPWWWFPLGKDNCPFSCPVSERKNMDWNPIVIFCVYGNGFNLYTIMYGQSCAYIWYQACFNLKRKLRHVIETHAFDSICMFCCERLREIYGNLPKLCR
jgi:hypothetical protein